MTMHRFANPGRFLRFADKALPWTLGAMALCLAAGLYLGLFYGETRPAVRGHTETAFAKNRRVAFRGR